LAALAAALPCGIARSVTPSNEPDPGPPPDLSAQEVLPALRSAALDRKIPLSGFDPFLPGRVLKPGDSVTSLITVTKGRHFKQWVAELIVVGPAGGATGRVADGEVIYTATGDSLRFKSGISAMRIRILGPVSDGDARTADCQERSVSATAHEDLLRMGADGLCRVILRFSSLGESPEIGYSAAPFTDQEIADGRKAAGAAGVTRQDELTFAGGAEVLDEFTNDAEDIPGIFSIATQGIDWPSVWTMLFKLNFTTRSVIDWNATVPVDQELFDKAVPVYRLPFALYMFGSHISNGGWFVTAPESPLTASGGIIGGWLQSVKHPENRLVMRVISAHRGR
jgi:hypothetical protein